MNKNASTQSVEVTRMRFDSARSFEEVRASLLNLMGGTGFVDAFTNVYLARDSEDFERSMAPFIGESGFMLFLEIDFRRWLPLYGIRRKATRLIIGNPPIAISMIRHDLTTCLFAPVELLLFEDGADMGSTITYDLPSSLMQPQGKPEFLAAARAFDAKLAALVGRATGVATQH